MTVLAPPRSTVRMRGLVVLGLVLAVLYAACSTWSIGAGFGGVDADGGWTDAMGAPTRVAPVQVQVEGHPMPWVYALLAAVLITGAVAARRASTTEAARSRLAAAAATSVVFVLALVLVCTGLQMRLVGDAIDAHRVPTVFGGAVLHVTSLQRG